MITKFIASLKSRFNNFVMRGKSETFVDDSGNLVKENDFSDLNLDKWILFIKVVTDCLKEINRLDNKKNA